jgi:hypothetical protein
MVWFPLDLPHCRQQKSRQSGWRLSGRIKPSSDRARPFLRPHGRIKEPEVPVGGDTHDIVHIRIANLLVKPVIKRHVGGPFSLIDQSGKVRTDTELRGKSDRGDFA